MQINIFVLIVKYSTIRLCLHFDYLTVTSQIKLIKLVRYFPMCLMFFCSFTFGGHRHLMVGYCILSNKQTRLLIILADHSGSSMTMCSAADI